MIRMSIWWGVALMIVVAAAGQSASRPAGPVVEESLEVGPVWAGHPVGFCLLSEQGRQYVAYYDDQRRMTMAARKLDEREWQYVRLPQTLGWDSHNYVTLAVDREGCLHLAGNMHCVPLVYFRTEQPHDISTFKQHQQMVGRDENRVTYPKFLQGPGGEMLFSYRNGSSGSGDQILNIYEPAQRKWRRLLDAPLTDGQGKMNAYFDSFRRDSKGTYHLCWVWRDTSDCATNHDVCYARSRDLVRWEKSDGTPLKLPITYASCEIVDPVPAGGGLINGNARLGFDQRERPVISYHKYDEKGYTQIYNTRLEDGRWKNRKVSDWDYRWEFGGGGSISFDISVSAVQVDEQGRLTQAFRNKKIGSGRWLLDADTLTPIGRIPQPRRIPVGVDQGRVSAGASKVQSSHPGIQVRWAEDIGKADSDSRYVLRWETLPPNRDRPRDGEPPAPSTLTLLRVAQTP